LRRVKWVDKTHFFRLVFLNRKNELLMEMSILKEKVGQRTEQIIDAAGYELLDFRLNESGKRTFIRIVVQSDAGITLQEITDLTRIIKNDEKFNNYFPAGYQLEVTSPGVDYPLKWVKDFKRNVGRKVRLFHNRSELPSPVTGEIFAAEGAEISLLISKKVHKFNINEINYGKVQIDL